MTTKRSAVPPVLTAIFVGFCVIMIWVYVEAKKLNPVQLDEYGHVRGEKR
jgi:hypothetical protein